MKIFPLLFCLIIISAGFASAQTNQITSCPTIEVSGGGVVEPGEPMLFTVHTKNYDLSKLTFNWTVSHGETLEGQGTSAIKVLKEKDKTKTVTVEVGGLPEGCHVTASETESLVCPVPVSALLDEFGALPNGEHRSRFDSLFIALDNNPNAQGYIINYGTKREITAREALYRKHIAFRNYDASRVTFVRGGANPNGKTGYYTRFWLVPPGATPPTP